MTGTSNQAGFTLIELLVSLALLGLMITLIGMALPLAMSGAARTSAISEELSAVQTAHELLRRQIGAMQAFQTQDGYTYSVLFSGTQDTMRFVARPVAAQGGGGSQIIELSVARRGSIQQLVYASAQENRNLVTEAHSIRFSYLGALAPDGNSDWRETWDDATRLPRLVRIQVQPKTGGLPWPDLIIAVLAEPPPT
jgi:general secretion pathway protein J